MRTKLKYIYPETLPSGATRYRFERKGKKVTMKGAPGTPEFQRQYAELLDGIHHTKESAAGRLTHGSVSWLVGQYMTDLERQVGAGLKSPLTLKERRYTLAPLVEKHGAKDMRMPKGKLTEFLDDFAATPGKRDNMRKAISATYSWGIERDIVSENPALKIKKINTKSEGFYICTIDDIRAYLKEHGEGTTARRVMIIELCTGARREDLRVLGRQHEVTRDGARWLRWRQSKAPNEWVEIPMLPMLQNEVQGHRDGCYVLTNKGAPYTHGSLGNMVAKWFKQAGAQGTLHGVRKGLASILPEYGATNYEIDVLLGHELDSNASKIYVKGAERAAIAQTLSERMQKIVF